MKEQLDSLNGMPANAKAERIFWYGHDTIILKGSGDNNSAIVNPAYLFDATQQKNEVLRSNTFPLASGRLAKILGLRVTHNLKFKNPSDIVLFEEYAKIKVNIENKDYTDLPIFDLLPYNRVSEGSQSSYRELIRSVPNVASDPASPATNEIWFNTTTGLLKVKKASSVEVIPQSVAESFQVLALDQKFKKLANTIDPPHQGLISIKFDPSAQNLLTDNITTYGHKFGAGIVDDTDSPVMWIKISYIAELIRTVK